MTLGHYVQVFRKRWTTILIAVVIGLGLSIGVTLLMTPQYAASATSFVRLSADDSQTAGIYSNSQFALSRMTSYTELVHSPAVLGPVIKELGLTKTVHQLNSQVSATNPTGTVLLVVQATDGSATRATQIANAVSHRIDKQIETIEAGGKKTSPVTVTTEVPATVPSAPVSPRKSLNIALGILLGLAIGIVIAIIREQLDNTVRSVDDLQELSGSSALGTIRFDSEFHDKPLAAMHETGTGLEDFRTIRTTLQFVNVDSPPRQIVISSAVANEGKTVTACNLAITMAQAELKVCLVEGDLRRPRATAYLGIDGTLGLTDVVADKYALDEVLVPWHRGELVVLPAGTTPPDPGQLLGSKAMASLLKELRRRFDLVIIDAPPLLPVSDAAVLAAGSDGAILVARYRHVRRDQFRAAIDSLQAVNADLLGAVLTHVPPKERRSRYGADYEYQSVRRPEPRPAGKAAPEKSPEEPALSSNSARTN